MSLTNRTRAVTQFVQLSANDHLLEARTAIGELPGIVIDEEGKPVSLINASDLAKIETQGNPKLAKLFSMLPPVIVTSADARLEDFVSGPEITALDAGARGAIVYDRKEIIGVLTSDVIDRFIVEEFKPAGQARGMETLLGLAGDLVTKPIILYCTDYNHRNELEYFDPDNPPDCQVKLPSIHPVRR